MSRLSKNEILKQYKRLHKEDLEEQRRQQLHDPALGSGTENDSDAAGTDGFVGNPSPPPAAATEEVVHDIDNFQDIGGSHLDGPPLRNRGPVRAAVPPAAAKAAGARLNPRSGRTSGAGSPSHAYGEDLDAAPASPPSNGGAGPLSRPNGKTPAALPPPPPAADGDSDGDDEFPDLDDVAPTVGGAALAYISPLDQHKAEMLEQEEASELVSSSSSGDKHNNEPAESSSSSRASASHSKGLQPRRNSMPIFQGDEASGVTVFAPTATLAGHVSAASMSGAAGEDPPLSLPRSPRDAQQQQHQQRGPNNASDSSTGFLTSFGVVRSPTELDAPLVSATFNVSGTSFDDPTNMDYTATMSRVQSKRKERPAMSMTVDGAKDDDALDSPGKPPRSPQVATTTAVAALAEALKKTNPPSSDDDDDAWVRPAATSSPTGRGRTGSTITFWPAVSALYADRQLWLSYATAPPAAATASGKTLSGKKPSFSLFSCCGCGSSHAAVAEDPVATVSATVVEDSRFVCALRAMPLDRGNPTEESILLSVFNGVVNSATPPSPVVGNFAAGGGGASWERVGFQGADPATDLRASGLLGLVATLYVVDHYPALTAKLWQLCNPMDFASPADRRGVSGHNNDIPFVLICFNFLGIVLDMVKTMGDGRVIYASRRNRISSYNGGDAEAAEGFRTVQQLGGVDGGNETVNSFALLHAICECLAGSLELFFESWLQLRKAKGPALPFVGDFGAQKNRVKDMIAGSPSGLMLALSSAMKARSSGALDSAEKSCV